MVGLADVERMRAMARGVLMIDRLIMLVFELLSVMIPSLTYRTCEVGFSKRNYLMTALLT